MMILENLQKTCDESNLAICLKNRLFFERILASTEARKLASIVWIHGRKVQQLVNNPG
jgi:hypothetical protein